MSRNSWRDISTRRPQGTGKQSTESNGGADSSSGSTPFLGKEYIKYRLRSANKFRIRHGDAYSKAIDSHQSGSINDFAIKHDDDTGQHYKSNEHPRTRYLDIWPDLRPGRA